MTEEIKSEEVSAEKDATGAGRQCGEGLRGLVPAEFRAHLRAARREMLLALRSLVDARLERLEEAERKERSQRATRIPVD